MAYHSVKQIKDPDLLPVQTWLFVPGLSQFKKLAGMQQDHDRCMQTFANESYHLGEIGKVGRWNNDASTARYVTLSDEVVDGKSV